MTDNVSIPPPQTAEKGLGARLRSQRHARGMSLQDLARASGVSISMISQIERDRANPSMRVLTAIRRALDLPVSAVFSTPDETPGDSTPPGDPGFVRRADRRPMLDLGSVRKELLTSGGHDSLQMMILHVEPEGHSGSMVLSYPSRKGGMLLAGELLLNVGGTEVHLRQGDSFIFDGMLEHSFANPFAQQAHVMWVIGAIGLDHHL